MASGNTNVVFGNANLNFTNRIVYYWCNYNFFGFSASLNNSSMYSMEYQSQTSLPVSTWGTTTAGWFGRSNITNKYGSNVSNKGTYAYVASKIPLTPYSWSFGLRMFSVSTTNDLRVILTLGSTTGENTSYNRLFLVENTSGNFSIMYVSTTSYTKTFYNFSSAVVKNNWCDVLLQKIGNNYQLFVDGTSVGTLSIPYSVYWTTMAGSAGITTATVSRAMSFGGCGYIGSDYSSTITDHCFDGYIYNVLVANYPIYNGNYTPLKTWWKQTEVIE